MKKTVLLLFGLLAAGFGCQKSPTDSTDNFPAIQQHFGGTIDPNNLPNYANQVVPAYISKDNTGGNQITDETATLGRVLFYDKKLSTNNSISCASCHQQKFAFSDPEVLSQGVNGLTARHSMRLVNARFGIETHFFWDERATSLEDQTTRPIQDHFEMGFSGANGDPGMSDLIAKLEKVDYYTELFKLAFGDEKITENRLQLALAQFVRSIQSFDSKYDEGRANENLEQNPFPNFSALENEGKKLFMTTLGTNGSACLGCHKPPEFDISPNIGNNGVIGVAGDPTAVDINITRAPSLRDVVNPDGSLNGPLMHTGSFGSLSEVIDHYNLVPNDDRNTKLDNHLKGPNGQTQSLGLTEGEKNALIAFLKTLTGQNVYTDPKYSSPFPE